MCMKNSPWQIGPIIFVKIGRNLHLQYLGGTQIDNYHKTQVIKQEPDQQETEPKAQYFLSCFNNYDFPALTQKSQPRKIKGIMMWRLLSIIYFIPK